MKAKQKYEIERTLVLSTGHITSQDDEMLTKGELPSPSVDPFSFGYRIYIGTETDPYQECAASGLSAALAALMVLAREQRCTWLKLDADGPLRDDLPKFDW